MVTILSGTRMKHGRIVTGTWTGTSGIREVEESDMNLTSEKRDIIEVPEIKENKVVKDITELREKENEEQIVMKEVIEFPKARKTEEYRIHRDEIPGIVRSMSRIGHRNARSKPLYSDCWLIGTDKIDANESYSIPEGDIIIGTASDGQLEYNLTPYEYKFDEITDSMISSMVNDIRTKFIEGDPHPNRYTIINHARAWLMGHTEHISDLCDGDMNRIDRMTDHLAETVYRYTMGLGIFEILLSDHRIEDIYIDAPCDRNRIHVTLNGIKGFNSHLRCRTNLIADKREVQNLISSLKRDSGLSFCESSPVLETDINGHDARATVVGYPMSPLGNAVAIRKHSVRPWTLIRLVSNGTIDAMTAGLLSFMVNMRSTFLISGARGAGKSSLLSALMFEFPLSQRILTIEDTMELPCSKMKKMGYKVQSMLIDDRMDGDVLKRSDDALRVSLRLGESAIILGEVRGNEARTLYQSMRTGKAGSSIMGTIHGDSAVSVYERVVHDMQIAPEAFMATDLVVTVGTQISRESGNARKITEIVSTSNRPGEFIPVFDNGSLSEQFLDSPVMKRIMKSASMSKEDVISEVKIRADIRSFLSNAYNDGNECGPEWIPMSNDLVSKELRSGNKDPKSVVNVFKQWFGRYNGIN